MNRTVLVGVVFLLTACTQAGTIETRKPITTDLGRFNTIDVTVTSKTQIAKSELERLETRLAERLTSVGRFRKVSARSVTPDNTRDLTLVVEVLTLPKGGFLDRSIFGEGDVKFDVTLVDRSTSQVIGACVVSGEASRGILWSSAGGRAVDEAIEKVVEFVARP